MKNRLLLILLMALLTPWTAFGQSEFTFGDDATSTSREDSPYGGLFGFEYHVYLYDAADVDFSGTVTSVSFKSSTSSVANETANYTLYMKDVPSTTTLSLSTTFAEFTAGLTPVFSSTSMPALAEGWNATTLTNTFEHQSGNSILVMARAEGCSLSGGCSKYVYYEDKSRHAWHKKADNTDPGPNVSGNNLNASAVSIKFTYTPSALCLPEDQCELTFTLTDSYGDGWNGAAIRVVDVETDILLASMSAPSHGGGNVSSTDVISLAVCDGRELRFEWVSGSCDGECSYVVTDINGNEAFSGSGAMSEPVTYTVSCFGAVQTIELVEGWNWISTYIDLNEVNGIAMLEEALGDYGVTIALQDDYAVYVGDGLWLGLEDYELTNAEMVMIEVTDDCTITLEGPAADPSTVEITLNPGWTWFGFPADSELELADILVDPEPEFGDAIAAYYGGVQFLGEWDGDFDVLLPGQGYVYWNESNEVKVLTFQTGAKTKAVLLRGKHKE